MGKSLKTYTLKHLVYILLVVVAVWAGLFYAFILDEVYDNVDDGLKNQKINIIRQAYIDSTVLQTREFGINQFRILPSDTLRKANVFSKEMIYMEYDDEMEPYRVLRTGFYAPNGLPYSLEIRTSTVEEDDFLINLTIALVVLYLLIVITLFLVNSFVLERALKPLKSLTKDLQNYKFGGGSRVKPVSSTVSEFIILDQKIQEMIDRNENLFLRQKQFIENASHELQTPLAITINKLDLLLENGELTETQSTEIEETKNSLLRMVNLNRSLLMLSRIENRQFEEKEMVSIRAVSDELLAELDEIIRFKNLTLHLENPEDFTLYANRNLMSILVSNLLRNAIRYNTAPGRIEVRITKNAFSIANTSALPPLNPTIIFERFYKHSSDNNSSGLGLSIVESIIKTYPELQLDYSYREGQHFFTIKKTKI